MSKTTVHTEFAALIRRPDGSWHKIHPFFCRSKEEAEKVARAYHERLGKRLDDVNYKIMTRTVTVTREDWHDLEE